MKSGLLTLSLLTACGSDDGPVDREFSATFEARAGDTAVGCDAPISGLGPTGTHSIGASDLRFYVSNVVLHHGADTHPLTLDDNEFQYTGETGSVALIDLTSNTSGSCAGSAIAFAEGTARTNNTITGLVEDGEFDGISFDVGVPQALMKEVINTTSPEGAPSPLAEMHWGWAGGYRHLVFNFTVNSGSATGEGYLHVGSRDCGGDGELALESLTECGRLYTPKVDIAFEEGQTIVLDIRPMLASLDFVSPIYDPVTFEVIGEGPGVECHSAPEGQPDCVSILEHLGIDDATGVANAGGNAVFTAE